MGPSITTPWSVLELTHAHKDYVSALHLAATARLGSKTYLSPIVEDLLLSERTGGVRLRPVVGGYRKERLAFAVVGVESPGASSLLLVPFDLGVAQEIAASTTRQAVIRSEQNGIKLCQVIGPYRMANWDVVLRQAGLTPLTDLIYLTCDAKDPGAHVVPHGSVEEPRWVEYSDNAEELFCEALALSYVQSQDCPELIDLRSPGESIQSHRSMGEFDPATWFVLIEGRHPVGVLLMNKVRRESVIEIAYMGVSQPARGRGVADALMAKARQISAQKNMRLILAVDARNEPARKLYARWSFVEVARRCAWIANLHGVGS